ncbi:MAG TPA: hypothetical protein VK386_10195 [Acidimicrobiales bacterium]|nr:hypothetical protein [Acidimicrobiales bacterium]
MTKIARRRRSRIGQIDRPIWSKALAVTLAPAAPRGRAAGRRGDRSGAGPPAPSAAGAARLHLPDLLGDEMLCRVKALPELSDTKVVLLSADATPGRVRRTLDLGVDGYLTKPVDVKALLQVADDQLARCPAPAP